MVTSNRRFVFFPVVLFAADRERDPHEDTVRAFEESRTKNSPRRATIPSMARRDKRVVRKLDVPFGASEVGGCPERIIGPFAPVSRDRERCARSPGPRRVTSPEGPARSRSRRCRRRSERQPQKRQNCAPASRIPPPAGQPSGVWGPAPDFDYPRRLDGRAEAPSMTRALGLRRLDDRAANADRSEAARARRRFHEGLAARDAEVYATLVGGSAERATRVGERTELGPLRRERRCAG